MKQLLLILTMAFASTVFAAEPTKKEPAKKESAKKAEKCVPSKEVVCDKDLQGKTRPTPKKKQDTDSTK
jgi:hypothetical protein